MAGEPVRGSWWAHPRAHAIFAASSALARHPEAIAIPLVSGKVTFVHRRLWPALLAVAIAREPWQLVKLPAAARALLKRVEKAGELETSGDASRELARRLLVRTADVHTDAGSHAKIVEAWPRWAARVGVEPLADVRQARRQIEAAVEALAAGAPRPKLPWPAAAPGRAA